MGEMVIGSVKIEWYGQSSVGIFGSKSIYIDPYVLPSAPKKADIILVTHEHFDHCNPEKIKQLQTSDTTVIVNPSCSSKIKGNIRTLKPGERTSVGEVEIKGTPSYNTNKQFHPRGSVTGFLITVDGKKVYHPGDTDFVPEMKELAHERIDVAFFPVGGTYTMNADEAAEAAKAIKPKIAVPMHYGNIVGSSKDGERFRKLLEGSGIEVRVLL